MQSVISRQSQSRWWLLFFAFGQPLAIGASALVGSDFSSDRAQNAVLVPPGPAFAVWGVIVGSTIAYSIWQCLPAARSEGREVIAAPLAITAAGFSAWIACASVPALTVLTVPVFAAMGAGLLFAVRATRQANVSTWPPVARGLLWLTLGTYLGWTSIAVWLNLSTVVAGTGAPVMGSWGFTWQLLLAAAAAGTAAAVLAFVVRVRTALAAVFGATTVYAFVGAAFGAASRDATLPAVVAVVLAVVLALSTLAAIRARSAHVAGV